MYPIPQSSHSLNIEPRIMHISRDKFSISTGMFIYQWITGNRMHYALDVMHYIYIYIRYTATHQHRIRIVARISVRISGLHNPWRSTHWSTTFCIQPLLNTKSVTSQKNWRKTHELIKIRLRTVRIFWDDEKENLF